MHGKWQFSVNKNKISRIYIQPAFAEWLTRCLGLEYCASVSSFFHRNTGPTMFIPLYCILLCNNNVSLGIEQDSLQSIHLVNKQHYKLVDAIFSSASKWHALIWCRYILTFSVNYYLYIAVWNGLKSQMASGHAPRRAMALYLSLSLYLASRPSNKYTHRNE